MTPKPGRRYHALRWLILMGMALCPLGLSAQRLKVEVEPNPATQTNRVEVTFTLEDNQQLNDFQPPAFPDSWKKLSGPARQQSVRIVNGAVSRSISIRYTFIVKQSGTFTLGPARAQSQGQTLRSSSVEVKVLSPSQAQKEAQAREERKARRLREQVREDLFIRAIVSKRDPYQGEQLQVTYKLYMRANITDYNIRSTPELAGFWSRDLETQDQAVREQYKGKTFRVVELKKAVLFPQKSGKLTIDPFEMECTVPVRDPDSKRDRFDLFSSPFGEYQNVDLTLRSNPIELQVRDWPSGAPPGFEGVVGHYDWNVKPGPDTLEVGDPYNLVVRVEGQGNLDLLQPFELDMPPDLERYDPQTETKARFRKGAWRGSKTFTYLMIPRRSGRYTIPELSLVYFDPITESYQRLTHPEQSVVVRGGAGQANARQGPLPDPNRSEVATLQQSIRYIKTSTPPPVDQRWFRPGSASFWVGAAAPVGIFLGMLIWRRHRRKEPDAAQRASRASKKLRKQLNNLGTDKEAMDWENAGRAMDTYLRERFGVDAAPMSREELDEQLAQQGLAHDARGEWFRLRDQVASAIYAPGALRPEPETWKAQLLELVNNIEQHEPTLSA